MKRSELLLPNGTPYEYLSREVTIKARLPSDEPLLKSALEKVHQEQGAILHATFNYP